MATLPWSSGPKRRLACIGLIHCHYLSCPMIRQFPMHVNFPTRCRLKPSVYLRWDSARPPHHEAHALALLSPLPGLGNEGDGPYPALTRRATGCRPLRGLTAVCQSRATRSRLGWSPGPVGTELFLHESHGRSPPSGSAPHEGGNSWRRTTFGGPWGLRTNP